MYGDMLNQVTMKVHFSTEEVTVDDGLGVERGTYSMVIADQAMGRTLQDVKNKHMHIMKRQADGRWKTWRMMVNSAGPAPESPKAPEPPK